MSQRKKRTVQEKYDYNKRNKVNKFSNGYVNGVEAYRDYATAMEHTRKDIKALNKSMAEAAKTKRDPWAIGYMCALRDCANERKGQ